jgi:phage tail-like protein
MDATSATRSLFLSPDQEPPRFHFRGLERLPDGSLTLARVPAVVATLGDAAAVDGEPGGPAAIAVVPDCTGDFYVSDPEGHRIWRYDACTGDIGPLPFLQGPGTAPGRLNGPRGLAVAGAAGGWRLYVAESGNHRVQVVDLATQQPTAIWGQPDPDAPPTPGTDPGRFDSPGDLAVDRRGNVYVLDHGNNRIQKFTPGGEVVALFGETLAAQEQPPVDPIRLAIGHRDGDDVLFVLDHEGAVWRLAAFTVEGIVAPSGWRLRAGEPATPRALALCDDAVYVGGTGGWISRYDADGTFIVGQAVPGLVIAALTCYGDRELLATGGGLPVTRFAREGGWVERGFFWTGPIETVAPAISWHRWRATTDPVAGDAHLQLFSAIVDRTAPDPVVSDETAPFASGWSAAPRDEADVVILSDAAKSVLAAGEIDPAADQEGPVSPIWIWLGGVFSGEGRASPVVRRLRLDLGPASPLRYLPAIYREGPRRRLFLDLALAALDSELGRVGDTLDELPRLIDPAATPADWLPWLGSWLDVELVEDAPETDKRRIIAEAFALYARRGTRDGLRRALKLFAGVDATIDEPIAGAALFVLDDGASLGFTTGLAPTYPGGAVLGRSATLGQSHLLPVEQTGTPLFADRAHRFVVNVHAAQLTEPATRRLIDWVLTHERPAHVDYEVRVVEPRMRVGVQATLGVDAIVGGVSPMPPFADGVPLDRQQTLPADPRWSGGRVGAGLRVGSVL